jgi:hypothetical protein
VIVKLFLSLVGVQRSLREGKSGRSTWAVLARDRQNWPYALAETMLASGTDRHCILAVARANSCLHEFPASPSIPMPSIGLRSMNSSRNSNSEPPYGLGISPAFSQSRAARFHYSGFPKNEFGLSLFIHDA